ncbi:metal-dependent hydrolase [Paenibacillus sp. GCM10023252]|uniref:metal-dependent hydrolase n=1 Tax=Paenibacillus sp. GCM10023252 TaxID=3252649 RepID=UPI00362106A5
MNKNGHLAFGAAAGAASLYFMPEAVLQADQLAPLVVVGMAALAGLAPDFDHKTSTISNLIQLSTRRRRLSRTIGAILLLIGVLLLALPYVPWVPYNGELQGSAKLWLGAGLFGIALSRIRSLILVAAGVALIVAYRMYDWHWIAAFTGVTLLLTPALKHRGLIHTPEFSFALSMGILSFTELQPWYIEAGGQGLVVGWWAHLAGDLFGRDGIHSLFIPKLKLALRLFRNGSAGERTLSTLSWAFCLISLCVFWIGL